MGFSNVEMKVNRMLSNQSNTAVPSIRKRHYRTLKIRNDETKKQNQILLDQTKSNNLK